MSTTESKVASSHIMLNHSGEDNTVQAESFAVVSVSKASEIQSEEKSSPNRMKFKRLDVASTPSPPNAKRFKYDADDSNSVPGTPKLGDKKSPASSGSEESLIELTPKLPASAFEVRKRTALASSMSERDSKKYCPSCGDFITGLTMRLHNARTHRPQRQIGSALPRYLNNGDNDERSLSNRAKSPLEKELDKAQ